jgi:indole-3-glycerol phosphate synthase
MNILDQILATKRDEIKANVKKCPFEYIFEEAKSVKCLERSFSKALQASDNHIIAEFKRRSPSKGFFDVDADVKTIVAGYSAAGAAAISVLTDR